MTMKQTGHTLNHWSNPRSAADPALTRDAQAADEHPGSPTERMGHTDSRARANASHPSNPDNAYNADFDDGNINNDDKSNDNNNMARCSRSAESREIFGFEALYRSYLACRRGKRSSFNALRFEANLEENLLELETELKNKTYKPRRSVCFTVTKPKPREIFAADFRDRIVHHVLVSNLEPIFERKFIFDSWACRKDKGTHAAVKRLQSFMRQATLGGSRRAYYLQLDVSNFFMTIDKNVLFGIITHHIDNPDLLWLAKTLIFHDPAENYIQRSPKEIASLVPNHKSLINAPEGKGLPIGNYSSQFMANVYLNELDLFIKHKLKCRFYLRYVDDLVLLSDSKAELEDCMEQISSFLNQNLLLDLRPQYRLRTVTNGVDFLGYVTRPGYILPRRRILNNLNQKLASFSPKSLQIFCLQATLNSYLGHLSHADAKKAISKTISTHSYLKNYFSFSEGFARLKFSLMNAFRKISVLSHLLLNFNRLTLQ
jgi:RNA-directed DNA polymerase